LQTTLEREADFLRKITTPQGEELIIQLEFQTTDEQGMAERMQLYFAMLRQKYRLPIRQFVIYVGNKPPKMRTQLEPEEVFQGFALLNLGQIDYKQWVASNIPEEVLLAVLGDFQEKGALQVLKQIISKLIKLIDDTGTLQKYIRQLVIFARYRNLIIETEQTLKSMGITYDIEKDTFFQRGVERGRKEGKLEGRKEGKLEGRREGKLEGRKEGKVEGRKEGITEGKTQVVLGLLKSGKMTVQEIASLAGMSVDEVQKIAKQTK
jgi:predicted transposase YdaD